jgi:hypothetical protein
MNLVLFLEAAVRQSLSHHLLFHHRLCNGGCGNLKAIAAVQAGCLVVAEWQREA